MEWAKKREGVSKCKVPTEVQYIHFDTPSTPLSSRSYEAVNSVNNLDIFAPRPPSSSKADIQPFLKVNLT